MISEACLLFGWTPAQCLKTPARTFFRILKEARAINDVREYTRLSELCDVVVCSNATPKYFEMVKDHYAARIREVRGEKPLVTQGGVVIPAESPEAGRQLLSIAKAKMRLSGLST